MQTKKYWDDIYTEGRDYRLMNKLLLKELLANGPKTGQALDIGSGLGQLANLLHRAGYETTGIDLSEVAVEQSQTTARRHKAEITFLQMDVESDFPSGKFDVITCKLVFIFMSDKDVFLENVKQHLTKDGIFIVITPVTVEGENHTDHHKSISIDETELVEILSRHFEIVANYVEYVNLNDKYMNVVCRVVS